MILTTCAACAAPLAHNAPRCVRCQTRYCNKTCQMDHWRRGHKQMCKKIHRGGNAEQYHADKKYKEAVAEAVEACAADDTKGQKCYICLEAVHARTGEGLVRGCACGDRDGVSSPELGVAHVSCLARQAKELVAEIEESNLLDDEVKTERWTRWHTCSLCGHRYHGVVLHALGWACWKTYLGRPERDTARCLAMTLLGTGLGQVNRHKERVNILEAELATLRRIRAPENFVLTTKCNMANCYDRLGLIHQSLEMQRECYAKAAEIFGICDRTTFNSALGLASSLTSSRNFAEAISFLRPRLAEARETLGAEHDTTLLFCASLAQNLFLNREASPEQLREAVEIMERTVRISQRVLGAQHPRARDFQSTLSTARRHALARGAGVARGGGDDVGG